MPTDIRLQQNHTLEDKIIYNEPVFKSDVREYLGKFIKRNKFELIWRVYSLINSEYERLQIKTDTDDKAIIHLIRSAKLVEYSADSIIEILIHDLVEDTLTKYFDKQNNIIETFINQAEIQNRLLIENYSSAQTEVERLKNDLLKKFGSFGQRLFDTSYNLSNLRLNDTKHRIIELAEKQYLKQIKNPIPKLGDRTENTITIGNCRVKKQKNHPNKVKNVVNYLSAVKIGSSTPNAQIIDVFYDNKLRYMMIFELSKFLENKALNEGKEGKIHMEAHFKRSFSAYKKLEIQGMHYYENYLALLRKIARKSKKIEKNSRNLGELIILNEFDYRIKRTLVESPPILYSIGNIERNIYFLKNTYDLMKSKNAGVYQALLNITKAQISNDSSRILKEIENFERSKSEAENAEMSNVHTTKYDGVVESLNQQLSDMKKVLTRMEKAQSELEEIFRGNATQNKQTYKNGGTVRSVLR